MRRKPYEFKYHGPGASVWCMKHYGDNVSIVTRAESWDEAVELWHSKVRGWEKMDLLGVAIQPVKPSTVEFVDATGEHSIEDLFGLVRQGALL